MAVFINGSSTSTGFENDFILAGGCRHFRYALNKEGATEIRVVPSFTDNQPDPIINPDKGSSIYDNALSDAIMIADVATFLGPGKAHMICPPWPGEKRGPVHTLIYTILDTVENDPKNCDDKWLNWCGKGRGNPKNVISRPAQVCMMQGYLFTHKGKPCVDKDGNEVVRSPVLLILNRSASNDLEEKLQTPLDVNGKWGPSNNQLGDFTDLDHGRILRFVPYLKEHNNREQTWYRTELGEKYPISQADALTVWRPWEQVLPLHATLPEIGTWLTKAFDASTVVKVFEGHPTYAACITDSIRMAADRENNLSSGRTTVGMDGYSYPPQPTPPPPQRRPYPPVPFPQDSATTPAPSYTQPQAPAPMMQQIEDPIDSPFDANFEEETEQPVRQDVSIQNRAQAVRRIPRR